jgi:hypothetical protein
VLPYPKAITPPRRRFGFRKPHDADLIKETARGLPGPFLLSPSAPIRVCRKGGPAENSVGCLNMEVIGSRIGTLDRQHCVASGMLSDLGASLIGAPGTQRRVDIRVRWIPGVDRPEE